MSTFPSVTGGRLIKASGRLGFEVIRSRGSHHFLRHPDGRCTVVAVHRGEIVGRGLMAQILRDCEITKEELQILLSLEEIGAYFGMKASAVSQTSRQFKTRTGKEGETDKMLCGILTKLHSVENRRAVAQAKGLRFDSLRANDAML